MYLDFVGFAKSVTKAADAGKETIENHQEMTGLFTGKADLNSVEFNHLIKLIEESFAIVESTDSNNPVVVKMRETLSVIESSSFIRRRLL